MRFDFGFGGHCEQYLHKSWCIIPSNCFFWSRGGGEGRLRGNFHTKPSKPFFSLGERGVGEVRLRVRLRVRRSLRAISAQILVHHPIQLFFFVDGGLERFDFGFGFGFVGHCEQFSYKGRKGWGRFDFGFGFLFSGHCEQYLHESWCIIPSNCFFCRGGLGRFGFGFGFGLVGHCEQFSYKGRCIIAATCFFGGGGWGSSTSGSVVVPSNVCTKPGASSQQTVFFFWGGRGRFDFGFGRGSL